MKYERRERALSSRRGDRPAPRRAGRRRSVRFVDSEDRGVDFSGIIRDLRGP
jgi:hypothetical protein